MVFHWNYLRVRGEYWGYRSTRQEPEELPPRARRIQIKIDVSKPLEGTTSACAENTVQNQINKPHARNYLRVRGEYFCACRTYTCLGELPPRARRIP